MKNQLRIQAVLVALLSAGCFGNDPPVILSFTVDEPNPEAGAPVQFSFSVTGAAADGIRIDPVPGPVVTSPVTVVPPESAMYTLSVYNVDGIYVSKDIRITVRPAFAITAVDATPGQVAPGNDVTLSWTTTSAGRATITDPTSGQVLEVATSGSMIVHPAATTVYTLTAYNKLDKPPPSLTAKITARVARPPSVSNFVADPPAITQGASTRLSWTGDAVNYSVTDGTTTFNVGPRDSSAYGHRRSAPGHLADVHRALLRSTATRCGRVQSLRRGDPEDQGHRDRATSWAGLQSAARFDQGNL